MKFFAAMVPSKPKSFSVRRLVRTSFALSFTSAVCRMESIGETRIALRAGIAAEMSVVTRHTAAEINSAIGCSTSRICVVAPVNSMPVKASRRQ